MDPRELAGNIGGGHETWKDTDTEMDRKASGKLRDSYIGRIPEEERAISVKFAWHELWSKVVHYLSREELMQLGEALVLAGAAHKEQKRSTEIRTLSIQ